MAIDAFHDLEVHIGAHRVGQGYPVQLILDRVRIFPSGALDADVAAWRPTGDPAADGRRLLAQLLADDRIRDSWQQAKGAAPQRRVRIRIDADAAELQALPWELLQDDGRALAADAQTPFSRFFPSDRPVRLLPVERPVRLLIAIANPRGLGERGLVGLDFEEHSAAILNALHDFPHVQAEILSPPTTLSAIESALREAAPLEAPPLKAAPLEAPPLKAAGSSPCTILHIVAHGEIRRAGGVAGLLLETQEGGLDWVSDDRLADMLMGLHTPPDCIVLMACHTAAYQAGGQLAGGALRGIAPRVLASGVPAVVAMQGQVTTASAGIFAASFYRQLASHGVLDLAVNEARHALQTGQRPDAAVPVLSSRLLTGQLWDFPPRRDFYRHVPLPAPEHYVARTEALSAVRAKLRPDEGPLGLALHGMAGAGKSVLARVLCDDPAVRATFPDGILWATLGRESDVTARLREWLTALGAATDLDGGSPSLAQLQNALADQLRSRTCLLVLDDLWRRSDATPFVTALAAAAQAGAAAAQAGAAAAQAGDASRPASRLLITTRDAALARELALDTYTVTPMSPTEAQSLLTRWGGETVTAASPDLRARVVERLGRLPLALRLAGAQLRRTRMDLADWLKGFDAQKLHSQRPESDQDNLFDTLSLSLADLSDADRQAFRSLAVFREGEAIPTSVVKTLWQAQAAIDREPMSDLTWRERLQDLRDRALVEPGAHGDEIRLHDLVRDFAMTPLGREGLRSVHRLLLSTYAQPSNGVRWSEIPDDGYLHAHLAYHLDHGGRRDAVAQLFDDDAWLHTRVATSGGRYDGYLDDLELAWTRADEQLKAQFDASASPTALADGLRYALIRASINTLATRTPPPLIAEAVAHRLWSVERALSVARRMPPSLRVRALHRLLMALGPGAAGQDAVAQAVLEAIRGLDDDPFEGAPQRAEALASVSAYLGQTPLHEALDLAQLLPTLQLRAQALAGVIPHLEANLQARVQATALAEIAEAIDSDTAKAPPAAQCAPYAGGHGSIASAYGPIATAHGPIASAHGSIASAHSSDPSGPNKPAYTPGAVAYAVAALAPGLTPAYLCQALAIACTLPDDWQRGEAVRQLIPLLSSAYDTPDALLRALDTTCLIEESYNRARVLTELIAYVTTRADAPKYLTRILAKAVRLAVERDRAAVLEALAPHLEADQVEQALEAARGLLDAPARVKALAALAPRLPDDRRRALLKQLFDTVRRLSWEIDRLQALADLAPALPPDTAERLVQEPALIGANSAQPTLWAQLAPHLPASALPAALEHAASADRLDLQVQLLNGLVPRLPEQLLPQAAAVIRAIGDPAARATALGTLATRYDAAERTATLGEALRAVAAIPYELDRAAALIGLAPQLSGPLIQQAMPLALGLSQAEARSRAVGMLASRLPTLPDAPGYLARLLEPEEIPDQAARAAALLALLPEAGPGARATIVETLLSLLSGASAGTTFDDAAHIELLCWLAPYCPASLSGPVADALRRLPNDIDRCTVLAALPPDIKGDVLPLQEAVVERLIDEPDAINRLLTLGHRLPAGTHRRVLKAATANARRVDTPYDAAMAWAAIASHAGWRARRRAITAANTALEAIEDPYLRILATTALLPELSGKHQAALREAALVGARDLDVDDPRLRADAFTELLPFLEAEAYQETAAAALQAAGEIDVIDDDLPEDALVTLAPQLGPQHLTQALDIVRGFETERARSRALAALAPLLRAVPDLIGETFELARALEDPAHRLRAAVALIPYAPDRAAHLTKIRAQLFQALRDAADAQRAGVLYLIADSDAFTPDILGITPSVFDAMALTVIEVSGRWTWM